SRNYVGAIRQGLGELEAGYAAIEALSPEDQERLGRLVHALAVDAGIFGSTLSIGLAHAGRFAGAREVAERSLAALAPVAAAGGPGNPTPMFTLAVVAAAAGRPGEARELFGQARALYRSVGAEVNVAVADM